MENKKIWRGLFAGLLLFIGLGAIGSIMAFLPDPHQPSIPFLIVVWSITLVIGISGVGNALKPSYVFEYLILGNLTNLILAGAIRGFSFLTMSWILILVLVCIYVFIWLFLYINSTYAKILYSEIKHPTTKTGKAVMVIFLILVGGGGTGGAILGHALVETVSTDVAMILLGFVSTVLLFLLTAYFSYPLWEKKQAKKTIT